MAGQWRWLAYPVVMAASSLFAASCVLGATEPEIDLNAKPLPMSSSASSVPAKDRLILAVAAVNSPMSTFAVYADLVSYLGDRLDMEARFVAGKTYAEINSLVRSGDATIAVVCSGAYVSGHEEFGMELLASPVINGQSEYQSYLIVHADSPIADWRQLRGGTFAFADPLSNSGRLVPLYEMWQMGETPESLLDAYIFTYSHENSIRSVSAKLVDAAAVDSLVYDFALSEGNPEVSKTKVIWRSRSYGINPVVVNPNTDPLLKERLRELFLDMHTNEEGRHILEQLMIDRFIPTEDGVYDSIREMGLAVQPRGAP